ncbi:MAG: 30S ribosomal protein S18 [Ardenticatenaceae bacterium]
MTTQSYGASGPQSSSRSGPGGRPGGGPRGPRRGGGRPRFYARRKVCSFCVDHIKYIDYKDVDRLRRFLSDRYKIEARRKTGMCAKHQRGLAAALKRARFLAMIPFSPDHRIPGSGYILQEAAGRAYRG